MDRPAAGGFLSLTVLRAEGCGIALGHTLGVRVLKMDRPDGRKVLKFDGLSGRGVRIARWAMLMKSALREFLPALIVILSRRRRISVQGTYELIDSKYQSAGKAKYQAPA